MAIQLASSVWRDFETSGVPASGKHSPRKREIREWGTYVESIISGAQVGGAVVFSTKAQADATLTYGPYQMAWVVGDTTPSNNGIYQKSGSSGFGFWSKKADLPYSFYRAHNVGSGSANAIQATTDNPIANTESLIVVNITDTNTASPVTLSLNGGAPITIKTASGNDPVVGGLVPNMLVAGYIDAGGTQFRMLSDQASAAIQSASESAAATAEAARDLAVDAADQAAIEGAGDVPTYPTRALAIAATIPAARTYIYLSAYASQGDGGFAQYRRVASDPSHPGSFRSADRFLPGGSTDSSDGGYWEIVMPAAGMSICAFGASTGEANNEPFIADAVTYLKTLVGPKLIIPPGDFTCTDPVILDLPDYSRIEFQGRIISSVSGAVAVRIGSDSAPTFGTRFTGVHVDRSATDMTSGGVTSSSIGVEIRNLVWAIGDIRRVTGFTVGLQVNGTEANGGVSYCQFHLGMLHDSKINLALVAGGVGYVNENSFYGGGFNHSSNYPNYTGTFNILVSHFAASPLNNNVFIRPSLEGNSSLTRAAELSGECNAILWPRLENPGDQTGFAIVFTAQSQECFLLTGFSIQNSNISDNGVANCVETRESKFLKKLTTSGNPLFVAQSINSSGAKLWQGRTSAGVESSSIDGNGGAAFSTLKLTSLPTSNPHVAGALWNSSGAVQISSG